MSKLVWVEAGGAVLDGAGRAVHSSPLFWTFQGVKFVQEHFNFPILNSQLVLCYGTSALCGIAVAKEHKPVLLKTALHKIIFSNMFALPTQMSEFSGQDPSRCQIGQQSTWILPHGALPSANFLILLWQSKQEKKGLSSSSTCSTIEN